MSCVDTALQSLYVIGLSSTLTVYSTLISSVTYFTARNKRNLHICIGAWLLLIYNVIYALLFLMGPLPVPIPGLINILHILSLLMVTLASISRYTSTMEGKVKVLTTSICNGILVLFKIICAGVTMIDVLISNEGMKTVRHNLTLIIPIAHVLFGIFYGYSRLNNPATSKSRKEDFIRDSMAFLIVLCWMVYFCLGVSSFVNTPFMQPVLFLSQSFALLCETCVASEEDVSEQNSSDETQPNNNVFTTTMAEGHSVMIETRASHGE